MTTEQKPVGKKELKTKKYEKRRFCPKCGSGVSLAEHKNRRSCGKCGYTEMTSA